MKSLRINLLCRQIAEITLNRGIHTDTILLATGRGGGKVPRIFYEPGLKNNESALEDDFEDIEHEGDLDQEADLINIDKSFDTHRKEIKYNKIKLARAITAKKFFSARPEPLTLTCNERQCIRYLHQQDPVQWDIKTLSESYPATTRAIKKIIKQKWKITPEKAKLLDEKVKKNWERLENGTLDADPSVLQHLKKFINRRPVLLDQIKNEKFYLPEIKQEPVWNNGEFSNILAKYEKTIEKLIKETEEEQRPKMLEDGKSREEKSSLDVVHEKIEEEISKKRPENKDSFMFQELSKSWRKQTTLDELENQILHKAEAKDELSIVEKAILEKKLGVKPEKKFDKVTESGSFSSEGIKEKQKHLTKGEEFSRKINKKDREFVDKYDPYMDRRMRYRKRKFEGDAHLVSNDLRHDDETKLVSESEVGKVLYSIKNPSPVEPEAPDETKVKTEIDFSDPERIKRENKYYDEEVMSIKDTAFWNADKTNKDKLLIEKRKLPHDGPPMVSPGINFAKSSVLSTEPYPERIKIPINQKGTGLTFRIKDCYYDDDGWFLYRVPGMVK